MKQCKTCGQTKPLEEFWYNPKTRDQLKTSCIPCCKEYNREHYKQNKTRRIKQIVKYQQTKRKLKDLTRPT